MGLKALFQGRRQPGHCARLTPEFASIAFVIGSTRHGTDDLDLNCASVRELWSNFFGLVCQDCQMQPGKLKKEKE
jgi:hypothetical protein